VPPRLRVGADHNALHACAAALNVKVKHYILPFGVRAADAQPPHLKKSRGKRERSARSPPQIKARGRIYVGSVSQEAEERPIAKVQEDENIIARHAVTDHPFLPKGTQIHAEFAQGLPLWRDVIVNANDGERSVHRATLKTCPKVPDSRARGRPRRQPGEGHDGVRVDEGGGSLMSTV
jgi:hypothetical protein